MFCERNNVATPPPSSPPAESGGGAATLLGFPRIGWGPKGFGVKIVAGRAGQKVGRNNVATPPLLPPPLSLGGGQPHCWVFQRRCGAQEGVWGPRRGIEEGS